MTRYTTVITNADRPETTPDRHDEELPYSGDQDADDAKAAENGKAMLDRKRAECPGFRWEALTYRRGARVFDSTAN